VNGDLTWLSIRELAPLIRDRRVSPVEPVRAMLDRIERLDPFLRAFITVTPEEAIEEARSAEAEIGRGTYRGPLHGIPVAHKDVYRTRGVRTTCHSPLFLDYVPDYDAAVVASWKAAGAIGLGKTNTYELASGREQQIFGIPRNPWNPSRVTGGSSSGSGGGLAAGLFYGASGTDGGGSIRAPAALCGVVGFRPTFGLVSRRGVQGSDGSTSCCGPMARSVADVALLLQPLVGYDPHDSSSIESPVRIPDYAAALVGDLKGVRVGVPTQYFLEPGYAAPDVLEAVRRAIAALGDIGAELVEVDLPHVHLCDAIYEVIAHGESAAALSHLLRTRSEDFGFSTRVGLEVGLQITAAEYLQAQQIRSVIQQDFRRAFEKVDLIVAPTAYQTARSPADDARQRKPHPRRPMSLPGGPSISVPCGFCDEGLPIGLQIVGRPWEDATVLRAAWAYEQVHPLEGHPDLSGGPAGPPLTIPPPTVSVDEAIRSRLESARRELSEAAASVNLEEVGPAVRFRP
jgi:aspartyl-tRNA(Asn)/glutamyl-tRNA(Gln) amidotransferase subunit A